jgi:rhodanese-related sulfurtransferase
MTSPRLPLVLAALFTLSGCGGQAPDYVTMIAPAALNQTLQSQDIFLVDVHTPEQKHIKGTDAFVPYDQVAKYQDRFPKDKATPIYLYCESGRMAFTAAETLYALGYRNLLNLEGGEKAWRHSGLPLE